MCVYIYNEDIFTSVLFYQLVSNADVIKWQKNMNSNALKHKT